MAHVHARGPGRLEGIVLTPHGLVTVESISMLGTKYHFAHGGRVYQLVERRYRPKARGLAIVAHRWAHRIAEDGVQLDLLPEVS